MTFGEQLKKLVKSKGLNFTSLAKKMGVNNVYLSQIVIGIRNPGKNTLQKLSQALNVPVDALLSLGLGSFDDNATPRKIPVLNETGLIAWMTSEDLNHPALYANIFQYASSTDSRAFYLQPSDSNRLFLGLYDFILIEPGSAIKNGDAVLACSQGNLSLGKIVMAHGLVILLNEKQEQVIFSEKRNIGGYTLFRAIQGIRNI